MLPPFNDQGLLPPGDYSLTIEELDDSYLVLGSQASASWDESWRRQLVKNLAELVGQLWQVGISEVFVDGSFTEAKDHPNDIDGYFECEQQRIISGELQRELNLLDPHKIWTWDPQSRRRYRGYPKKQLPMWLKYRVELYPHIIDAPFLRRTGIKDRHGHDMEFPSAFRQSRDGQRRGIVRICRGASDASH
ncbi:MAG: hypothetical protein HQ582_12590 [Planctomycetes bacterium]|nr:hypothetical protein [Planctomycetota bacterium]